MSHFTVLVIGEDPEGQLAPFQENNMGDCPREYMEFNDVEDEEREKYETGTIERIVMPDGRLLDTWEEEAKEYIADVAEKLVKAGAFPPPPKKPIVNGKRNVVVGDKSVLPKAKLPPKPEPVEKRKVPYKELFATFEEYMAEWCGHKERDEVGRYGYWSNPNTKWDWYLLGGRWTGYFKLKAGADGTLGEPGAFGNKPPEPTGYADQCRIKDIDLDGMYEEAEKRANESYDKFEAVTKGLKPPEPWKTFFARFTDIDVARQKYAEIPWVKALRKAGMELLFDDTVEYYCVGSGGREAFVSKARMNRICTFALLKDGEWYEQGQMGWFGFAADKKEDGVWAFEFHKLLGTLPPDTLVSVYDCHI
jgi:hypothetical protein